MFNIFKKKKERSILSTQNGKSVSLSDVPDDVFAQKMLGDGVAIIPVDDKILSPVDGTVTQITDTLHAYGIHSDDGLDILIHVGLDTVKLKGEGFKVHVKEGQRVKSGELIANVDINLIKEKGFNIHTPIIVTNINELRNINMFIGDVKAGETEVIKYEK